MSDTKKAPPPPPPPASGLKPTRVKNTGTPMKFTLKREGGGAVIAKKR